MPVHYAGLPCKIEDIDVIAKQNRIMLIEDAAESLGATIGGRKVGTWGDLSMFSFAGNKVVTTGEGEAITTNSRRLFEKLKLIRSHGCVDKQSYFTSTVKPDYVTIGYNWRMSSITAALGMSQLEKIEKLISLRRKKAIFELKAWKAHANKCPTNLLDTDMCINSIPYYYQILVSEIDMKFLARRAIMSKVFFDPGHLTSFYKKIESSKKGGLNVTEKISHRILTLPMYPSLQKEEIDYICESVKEFTEQENLS